MSYLTLSASFKYLCYRSTVNINVCLFQCGDRLKMSESDVKDVRFWRLKSGLRAERVKPIYIKYLVFWADSVEAAICCWVHFLWRAMKILPFMPTAIIMYWDDSKRHPREFMSYKISCKDGVHVNPGGWVIDCHATDPRFRSRTTRFQRMWF